MDATIISIDGITDKNKIAHFVKNMPAWDSKSLRRYVNNNEPGIDMTHEFVCKNCGHKNNAVMPMNSEFFWPTK